MQQALTDSPGQHAFMHISVFLAAVQCMQCGPTCSGAARAGALQPAPGWPHHQLSGDSHTGAAPEGCHMAEPPARCRPHPACATMGPCCCRFAARHLQAAGSM
jgi:hypothetical protein